VRILLILALSLVASCGKYALFKDRNSEYLQAKTEPKLKLPPHLEKNADSYIELMPIPSDVVALNTQQAQEVQRPNAVSQQEELQEFSLQHSANGAWLLVLREPAQIWVATYNFWQNLGFKLQHEKSKVGEIISTWHNLNEINTNLVRQNLTPLPNAQNINVKIIAEVKQGLQPNSSEITLQVFSQNNADKRNPNLELELLTNLQKHLTNAPSSSVSMLASQYFTGYSLPTLEQDTNGNSFLTFNADFDRTWAYLNAAINATLIKVEDIDRSKGIFYVDVAAELPKPNFFVRMFKRQKEAHYQLHIKAAENKQIVTVYDAPPKVAEQVLNSLYQQLK